MRTLALAALVLLADCSDDDSSEPDAQALACPAAADTGIEPGEIVPNAEVRNCNGDTVQLHDFVCGHAVTLIDLGGAAFAECVAETDAYATSPEYDGLQARGLQIVQAFVIDEQSRPPTSLFCREYSDAHAVDFEFLIDPLQNTRALAEQYPFNLVLDSQARVVHKWATDIPDDKLDILSSLLP